MTHAFLVSLRTMSHAQTLLALILQDEKKHIQRNVSPCGLHTALMEINKVNLLSVYDCPKRKMKIKTQKKAWIKQFM